MLNKGTKEIVSTEEDPSQIPDEQPKKGQNTMYDLQEVKGAKYKRHAD